MSEDGPVLDPTEVDIEDDERVREIGEDRYVVSASGDPPAPSGHGHTDGSSGGRRGDQPTSGGRSDRGERAGGSSPAGDAAEGVPDEGVGRPAADRTTRAGSTPGVSGANGTEPPTPSGDGPQEGRRGAVPGGRDPPTSEASRQRGTRAAGGTADRGAAGGGWDRHAEQTGRQEPHGARDTTGGHPETGRGHPETGRGHPETGPDAAAVSRWLADSLRDNGFAYGFDATVSMDGEVSRHRTVSDDVTEAFETLAVWFARNASDGDPERALGVLLSRMDTSVELPPDLIRQAAVEHDLSADDSIRELVRAVREDGHVTLE